MHSFDDFRFYEVPGFLTGQWSEVAMLNDTLEWSDLRCVDIMGSTDREVIISSEFVRTRSKMFPQTCVGLLTSCSRLCWKTRSQNWFEKSVEVERVDQSTSGRLKSPTKIVFVSSKTKSDMNARIFVYKLGSKMLSILWSMTIMTPLLWKICLYGIL